MVKILTINTLGYSQNNLHTYNSTDVTTHYYCSSWTYKFTPWASFWASYWVFSSCNSTILQQLPFVKGSRFDLKYWLNSSIVCFWWTVLPTSIKEKRVQVEKDQIIVDFDDSFCQDAGRPPPNKKILSPKINCYLSREQQPPPLPLLPSVTRWLDHSDNIWPFITMNFCPITNQVAKVGSQFCQILIKPSKNCQRLKIFHQSGKISPNLATLTTTKPTYLLITAIIGYLIDSIRSWHEWSIRAITDHAIL